MKVKFAAAALVLVLAAPAFAQSAGPALDEPVLLSPAQDAPVSVQPEGAPAVAEPQRAPARAAPSAEPERIEAAIIAYETDRFGACAQNNLNLTRISGGAVAPRTVAERQLRAGGVTLYHYTYTASGCDRPTRRHNVDVLAHEGLEPLIVPLPTGTTALTSGVLTGAFETIFTPMMRARYPQCTPASRLKILEANVTRGTPYTRGASWVETWSYDACGGLGTAVVTFAYDGDGLRMTANVQPAS